MEEAGQVTGILRHELMDFMFADPEMLDDLEYLFKDDMARKLMFYHQAEWVPKVPKDPKDMDQTYEINDASLRPNLTHMKSVEKKPVSGKKVDKL